VGTTLDTRGGEKPIQPTRVYSITWKPCLLGLIRQSRLRQLLIEWSSHAQTTRKSASIDRRFGISRRIKGSGRRSGGGQRQLHERNCTSVEPATAFLQGRRVPSKVHGETARRDEVIPSFRRTTAIYPATLNEKESCE
jgi:hypothetical protein